MDNNEAIVDQIVRSLSFEVVAVPQHAMQVDNTAKSTPLNVKIRVRKKHGAELRHGVLSMPKVDTRSDSQKKGLPERAHLVSSDQTIMDFNVLMEADFDKRHPKQNLNMVIPDSQINNNKENSNLSKPANDLTTPIFSKRNKDIFGRCKPGGCLDPPFGEDKYSYQPTQQNIPLPIKDDAVKLRSSSIFKNNIFKRKKRSSPSDHDLDNIDINKENEVGSKRNLNKKSSLETSSPFSSAIITYPHPSDSEEFSRSEDKKVNREEEKSYRKRYSSDERSKTSSIKNGSYFIIPKKTKNVSSDLNKTQKNYPTAGENDLSITKLRDEINLDSKNILRFTENVRNIENNKTDDSKLTSQAHNFTPIPSIVSNAVMDSKPTNNEIFDIYSEVEMKPLNDITQKEIKAIEKPNLIIDQEILISSELKTLNSSGPNKETEINTVEKENHIETFRSIQSQDTSAKQDIIEKLINTQESVSDDDLDITQNIMMTTSKENFNESNIDNAIDNKYNSEDQTDFQSESLLADREKSILDIVTDQVNTNSTQNQSENDQNVPFSSHDLKHIWTNEVEALKSLADVITKKTILPTQHDKMNIDGLDKIQHNSPKPVSHNVNYIYEEYSTLEKIPEKSADDTRSIFETDLKVGSVTPSNIHSNKTSAEDVTKKIPFDKEHNMVESTNIGEVKPELLKIFPNENLIDNKDVQSYGSKTSGNKNNEDSVTKENLFKNFEKLLLPEENFENLKYANFLEQHTNEQENKNETESGTKFDNSKNGAHTIDKYDKSSKNNNLDFQKDMIDKQNDNLEHSDASYINKVGDVLKVAFKETSHKSFSDSYDNITIEDFPHGRKRSVSEVSIMGSASLTQNVAKEDSEILKIYSSSNLEETDNVPTKKEEEVLNDTVLKQTPYLFLENKKLELKTKLRNIDDTGKMNLGLDNIPPCNVSEILYEATNSSNSKLALREGVIPWRIDIALHSYVDENNEKVIKSFNSEDVPERRLKDAFLAARCYLKDDLHEVKIPIDQDNELIVTIAKAKAQHRTLEEFNNNINSNDELFGNKKVKMDVSDKSEHQSRADAKDSNNGTLELYRKKKIKIGVLVSDSDVGEECTSYEEINKSEDNKYNKAIMSGDIRNALNAIYEEELVPLQDIIKGLREEIDALTAYQIKLNALNLSPKRSKPIRLVDTNKKYCCARRL